MRVGVEVWNPTGLYFLSQSARERYPFLLVLYSNVYFVHIVTLVFELLALLVPLELLYVS